MATAAGESIGGHYHAEQVVGEEGHPWGSRRNVRVRASGREHGRDAVAGTRERTAACIADDKELGGRKVRKRAVEYNEKMYRI